jgi:hypothetical protein
LDGGDLLVDLRLLVAGACVERRQEKEVGREGRLGEEGGGKRKGEERTCRGERKGEFFY